MDEKTNAELFDLWVPPPGAKLLSEDRYPGVAGSPSHRRGGTRRREYLLKESDLPDKHVRHVLLLTEYLNEDGNVTDRYEHKSRECHQKFLCVNGPHQGKKMTEDEGNRLGYIPYNRSSRSTRASSKAAAVVLVRFE